MYPTLVDPNLMANFTNHQNYISEIEKDEGFRTPDSYDENPNFISEIENGEGFQTPDSYDKKPNFISEIEKDEDFQTPDSIDEKPNFVDVSEDSLEIPDFSDACIKFLGDILLEGGLDETPITVQEYKALQETEKSLYDVLGEEYSPTDDHDLVSSLYQGIQNTVDGFDGSFGDSHNGESSNNGHVKFELKTVQNPTPLEPFLRLDDLADSFLNLNSQPSGSSYSDDSRDRVVASPVSTLTSEITIEKGKKSVARSSRKKNRRRDDAGHENGRGNKQQAASNEDYVEMEEYDDILLCTEDRDKGSLLCNEVSEDLPKIESKGRTKHGKKSSNLVEEVDLRTLLNHCAQAVSTFDLRTANERLKQIRQHSSPYGDSTERIAHYFANALEARIAGTGSTFTSNIVDARISSADFLKAYRVYVSALPFKRVSYYLANKTIRKWGGAAKKIHIIDFGILLGLQWPCFIQALSERPGGPTHLRITGIDYPQHGFRPLERVEATGRRLSGYCERFKVPFKYQAIAKKWSSIQPEDINIESDELVVVNCMYRSGTLLDETVESDSSKDAFLKLVKELNPHLFIHGVINGTFNAPFFHTRFKEALFYYSALFDVFETTIPREDHARLLLESELNGKELLNVIACEGAERIQRPESFKQWQVRTQRAGLKQLPLDRELLKKAKATARAHYLEDFVVDEDKNWLLQGWKGRIFCALSFWQPR